MRKSFVSSGRSNRPIFFFLVTKSLMIFNYIKPETLKLRRTRRALRLRLQSGRFSQLALLRVSEVRIAHNSRIWDVQLELES